MLKFIKIIWIWYHNHEKYLIAKTIVSYFVSWTKYQIAQNGKIICFNFVDMFSKKKYHINRGKNYEELC